jgi:hypothetical protein
MQVDGRLPNDQWKGDLVIHSLTANTGQFGSIVRVLFISFFEWRMLSHWIVTNISSARATLHCRKTRISCGINSWSVNCILTFCPIGVHVLQLVYNVLLILTQAPGLIESSATMVLAIRYIPLVPQYNLRCCSCKLKTGTITVAIIGLVSFLSSLHYQHLHGIYRRPPPSK